MEKLGRRLQQPLPGLEAQLEMAPPARGNGVLQVPPDAKKSAVLILLYPHEGKPHTVFMKRAEDQRVHSGQISFPGGRIEPQDPDIFHTALREAQEEIGLDASGVRILGRLSDMYIPPSNFLVYPALGYTLRRPDFVPDAREVAAVIEAPLAHFWEESSRSLREIEQRTRWGHYRTTAPAFQLGEHIIWGATAMMLNELLKVVKELD